MKTYRLIFSLLVWLLYTVSASMAKPSPTIGSTPEERAVGCPMVKIKPKVLPRLNIPRSGHYTMVLDGVVYVMGGHTSGFVPTPTAEYYENGEWHVLNMVYTHDHALCMPLRSGKVLLAGGHEKPLGIGHTFTVELFDPKTRLFDGYGCLEKKRFFLSGAELADGRVIISGNALHDDCVECFDGTRQNKFVKAVSQERSIPYIYPVADDNVLIFSSINRNMVVSFDTIVVDQLKGDPLHVPLFDEWYPLTYNVPHSTADSYIGDEKKGQYAYLFTVSNKKSGQMAIARMEGTDIQLLPTDGAVPMESRDGPIIWFTSVIVDRRVHRGYVVGRDDKFHLYVLAVEYDKRPAPLTFYCVDSQDVLPYCTPVLTPEGDLVLAGGLTDNNFTPFDTVLLFPFGQHGKAQGSGAGRWLWLLGGLLFVAVAGILLWLQRRGRRSGSKQQPDEVVAVPQGEEIHSSESPAAMPDPAEPIPLMADICQLMDEQQMYLNSELKVADVAFALEVSNRAVSDCIKTANGQSFTQFVNGYRIEHAKLLLRTNAEMKIAAAALQSGFANEMSFFRSFKSIVGMTPREWVEQQRQGN